MKRSIAVVLCAVAVVGLGLLSCALPVFAQGDIRIGKVKVTPKVAYKGELNDNIYLRDDEESDFINTLTPGIGFSFEDTPGNYVNAGYEVDLVGYTDNSDNNYEAHRLTGGFGLKSPLGLYLKVSDHYVDTGDPYGTDEEYKLGVPETERWNNTVRVSAGYEFADRFTIEAEYKNFVEKFDLSEDEWQDREDDVYGATFSYKFMPKTSVLVQYRRTERDYMEQEDGAQYGGYTYSSETSENYRLNDYLIGLHWEPGAKISGDVKFGWGDKEYDNDRDPDGNKYEDNDTWIAETMLLYKASEKTTINAHVMRSIKESTRIRESNYYIDTAVGLGLNQALVERFYLNFGLEYRTNEHDAHAGLRDRTDDIYNAQVELEYRIQTWLTASAGYEYEKRDCTSDYKEYEYTVNKGIIRISALF